MTRRRRFTSSSFSSWTRRSGLTPVSSRIFFAVDWPIPKMYVSPISIRLLRGRSTPAIRAMALPLPLLVPRVLLADDPNDAPATDHLAMLTDRLDAATHLHERPLVY